MGASFKVLIIKNIFTGRPWGTQMVDDIAAHIRRSIPDAQFEVCAAAEGQNVPDLSLFQLVVLTGGMLDLITSADEAWVQQVLSGVRGVMADDSETKLVGMCWGHQAIHLAMGGTIGVVPTGPRVGVEDIQLTPEGMARFSKPTLALHKLHKHCVITPAPGFTQLAYRNEICISADKRVVTFQGHPEFKPAVALGFLSEGSGQFKGGFGQFKGIDSLHDGEMVWDNLLQRDGSARR